MYDCIVIGGGIIGCSILREMSRYNLSALLLEKNDDVACGASRANSGINHAGYDAEPQTNKAKFNVLGNKMYPELCKELGLKYLTCGSLVVGDINGLDVLKKLKDKGDANGVETYIINRDEILEIEPNIADDIEYALYAPNAGVFSPYKFTIACAEDAIRNGAEIRLSSNVEKISYADSKYRITLTNAEEYECKYIINCAGAGCMKINELAGAEIYSVIYRRGDYYLLDKTERKNVNTVIFPLPDERGKGILVAPTADGNVIYGPTAINEDTDDTAVTTDGLKNIREGIAKSYKSYNFKKVIRVYAGVRTIIGEDFVIGFSEKIDNFYMVCGICSPGLTSAPAIAQEVTQSIVERIGAKRKSDIIPPQIHKHFIDMSNQERKQAVEADRNWGEIICRCESVTKAEIKDAIDSPLHVTTLDGIKRRVRAGMGRCQGGFCAPKIIDILVNEYGLDPVEIKKGGVNSNIITGSIKEDGYEM